MSTLAQQLQEQEANAKKHLPENFINLDTKAIKDLIASNIAEKAVKSGK
jgi:hypothetical protein